MDPIAVVDFETTGLSPSEGARATEVAAVIVQDGKIVSRYQNLMNSGVYVPSFITDITGITNSMVQSAPPSKQVMNELCEFIGPLPIVAHNASFDKKFFEHECRISEKKPPRKFACSMLISRRIFPNSPNHKLGTLVDFLSIQKTGRFHRALSDAEMTARLLLTIFENLKADYRILHPTHAMLMKLQRTKYADIQKTLHSFGPVNSASGGERKSSIKWNDRSTTRPSQAVEKVVLECPNCSRHLRVPVGRSGTIRCPGCSSAFKAST